MMQASRTTCERRSLAESLNAASMSRSCCRKPSKSAAPARSSERTFFSWKTRRRLSAGLPPEQLWGRGAGVRLQPPLSAPSPACHRTARPGSSSWPPPPPCWSRSGGEKRRKMRRISESQKTVLGSRRHPTCTAGTSSKAWMKSSSSTAPAPAPEPSLPAHTGTETHTHTP